MAWLVYMSYVAVICRSISLHIYLCVHTYNNNKCSPQVGFFDLDDLKSISTESINDAILASCCVLVLINDEVSFFSWFSLLYKILVYFLLFLDAVEQVVCPRVESSTPKSRKSSKTERD